MRAAVKRHLKSQGTQVRQVVGRVKGMTTCRESVALVTVPVVTTGAVTSGT